MARDLRLFYLFRLLATSYLWVPIFYFFMLSRGLGFDEIMILSAIYSGVVILIEIPTGAFADRIGRRESMMAGALAMVASTLVAYSAHGFGQFLVAEVLAAISISLCSGADSAYLYDLLQSNGRTDEYARREGTASAWHQGGSALAFAAGGFLAHVDLALPYLVTAFVSTGAFVVAMCMRKEGRAAPGLGDLGQARAQRGAPLGDELRKYFRLMGDSLKDVASNRKLGWIIFYSAVVFALLRATVYLYQPYLDVRGFQYWQIGLVFFGIYVVATFVAHRADALRRAFGEEALVWGLLGTLALSFVLLNRFSGEWAVCMLMVQAGTKGLYSPLVKPILNREIHDSSRRATVLSVESIARRTAMGVFSLIAAFYGAKSAIYIGGGIGLVGFALLLVTAAWSPLKRTKALIHRAHRAVPAPVEDPPVSAPATLD